MTDNKENSMVNVQRQLMMEQAKVEQDFAKIDRLMKGRQVAFALATEVIKMKQARDGDKYAYGVEDIIKASRTIEDYLSEGAKDYLALAKKLNDLDEEQDKVVLASVN